MSCNWEDALNVDGSELEKTIREEMEPEGYDPYKNQKRDIFDESITTYVPNSSREMAVRKFLIPETYKDAVFDREKIELNIKSQGIKQKNIYNVERLDDYINICNSILSTLRVGKLPDRSWLIGAPNGFGKSSFVSECIITMEEKSMRAVPYISLSMLGALKIREEYRLLNPFSSKVKYENREYYEYTDEKEAASLKLPERDPLSHYGWWEYMQADCLFCCLTDISSKNLESRVLYHVLMERGRRGLPTVVMMSTSLLPYTNDSALKEYVWDEILADVRDKKSLDRLVHISCYKVKNDNMIVG